MLSALSTIRPPVGKSGPFTHCISSIGSTRGLSIKWVAASSSSATLCGGIEVAMPMVFADRGADHARAFLVRSAGIEAQQPHRPEQPAVDRLQPVADVGERASGDGGERVDEITLGQGFVERGVDDLVEFIRNN